MNVANTAATIDIVFIPFRLEHRFQMIPLGLFQSLDERRILQEFRRFLETK